MRRDGPLSAVESDPQFKNFPEDVQARILADAQASPRRDVPTPKPAPTPARVRPIFETDPPPPAKGKPKPKASTLDRYPLRGALLPDDGVTEGDSWGMPETMSQQLAAQRGRLIPKSLAAPSSLLDDQKEALQEGLQSWLPVQLGQRGLAEAQSAAAPPPLTRAIPPEVLNPPAAPRDYLTPAPKTWGQSAREVAAGLAQDLRGGIPAHALTGNLPELEADVNQLGLNLGAAGRGVLAGGTTGAVSLADPSNFIMPQEGGRLLQAGLGAVSGAAQSVALGDPASAPGNILTQAAMGALTGGKVHPRETAKGLSPGGLTDATTRALAQRLNPEASTPRTLRAELDDLEAARTPPDAPHEAEMDTAPRAATPAGARRGSIGTGPEPQRDSRGQVLDTRTYPNTVNPNDHMNQAKWNILDGPESARLRQLTADTVMVMNGDHKARRSGAYLEEKARQVPEEHIDALVKQGYQEGRPLSEDEYMAVQGKLADLMPRITDLSNQLAESNLMVNHAEVRKNLNEAEASAKGLVGLLSPSRSDKGRALAYLKEQAKQGFDADYWMSRAEREAGAALSGEQITSLAKIIDRGKKSDDLRKAKLTEAENFRKRREALEQNDAGIEATPGIDLPGHETPARPAKEAAPEAKPEPHPLDALLQEFQPKAWDPSAPRTPREPKPRKATAPAAPKSVKELADYLKAEGAARIERNQGVSFMSSLGAGHADLALGHVQVLAGDMLHRAIDFADWAKEMHAAHGDGVIPHLPKIWTDAEKLARRVLEGKPLKARPEMNERVRLEREADKTRPAALGGIVKKARTTVEKAEAKAAHDKAAADAKATDKAHADAEKQVQEKKASLARIVEKARNASEIDKAAAIKAAQRAEQELGEAMGKAREAAKAAREKAETLAQSAASRAEERAAERAARDEERAAAKAVETDQRASEKDRQGLANTMGKGREAAERDRLKADTKDQTTASKVAEKAARDEEKASLKAAEKTARAHARAHAESVRQVNVDLAKYMATIAPSTKLEVVAAFRKAGLLTGVKTIARNMGSNTANLGLEEAVKLPAALFDAGMSMLTKRRTVLMPTPKKVARGFAESATTGVREFGETMVHGIPLEQLAAMEIPREINSGNKYLDGYINGVFRFQSAQDRLFKAYAVRRSLDDQAALEVGNMIRERKLRPTAEQRRAAIQDMAANPTDEMLREALADAEFMTFQNETWAGNLVAGLRDKSRRYGHGVDGPEGTTKRFAGKTGNFVIDLILPFSKTPSAVATRIIQYTPLGPLGTTAGIVHARWAKEVAGALTAHEQKAIALGLSRGMVGSCLITMGAWLYNRGLITPSYDQASRGTDEAAGRTPGAIKIAGSWVPIGAVSPIGNLMVLGATLAKEGFTSAAMVAGAARTVLDSPMSQGAKQLAEQANPGEEGLGRTANKFVGQMAGSFVPTLLAEGAQALDPEGVDRQTSMESAPRAALTNIQKRLPIPGGRGALPAKTDGLGQAVKVPTGASAFGAFAGRPALEDTDPVVAELVSKGIQLRPAQRTVTVRGVGVPLTEAEQMALFKLTGHYVREKLAHKIDGPTYGAATDVHQEARLKEAIELATAKATREIRADLANKAERVKQAKALKQQKQQTRVRTVQGGVRPANATSSDLLQRPGSGDDATF